MTTPRTIRTTTVTGVDPAKLGLLRERAEHPNHPARGGLDLPPLSGLTYALADQLAGRELRDRL